MVFHVVVFCVFLNIMFWSLALPTGLVYIITVKDIVNRTLIFLLLGV